MASVCAVSMATPMMGSSSSKTSLFSPLPAKFQKRAAVVGPNNNNNVMRFKLVEASANSLKEKAVTGLTAAALTVSMMVPDVAEAAELPPSLKNLLLSVVAGGVVVSAILGAIIAVSNFDPVKRV